MWDPRANPPSDNLRRERLNRKDVHGACFELGAHLPGHDAVEHRHTQHVMEDDRCSKAQDHRRRRWIDRTQWETALRRRRVDIQHFPHDVLDGPTLPRNARIGIGIGIGIQSLPEIIAFIYTSDWVTVNGQQGWLGSRVKRGNLGVNGTLAIRNGILT